jgi:DNA-binding XRE family transcriptional regulator
MGIKPKSGGLHVVEAPGTIGLMSNSNPKSPGRPVQACGLPQWWGDTLRLLRTQNGESAEALAAFAGVSRSTVLRWERSNPGRFRKVGRANEPSKEQVRLLAAHYNVPQKTFSRRARVAPVRVS